MFHLRSALMSIQRENGKGATWEAFGGYGEEVRFQKATGCSLAVGKVGFFSEIFRKYGVLNTYGVLNSRLCLLIKKNAFIFCLPPGAGIHPWRRTDSFSPQKSWCSRQTVMPARPHIALFLKVTRTSDFFSSMDFFRCIERASSFGLNKLLRTMFIKAAIFEVTFPFSRCKRKLFIFIEYLPQRQDKYRNGKP